MLKNVFRSLLVISLVIVITGCKTTTTTKPSVTSAQTSNVTTSGTTGTTTASSGATELIKKSKDLIVKDIATEFQIDATKLPVYTYLNDPKISYVNIAEFIQCLQGGIVELDINKTDVLTISYTFDIPLEYQDLYGGLTSYTYEMTLDAAEDYISYTDFDMVSNINGPTLTEYETDLVVSNIEYIEADSSMDIDLASYGYDLVLYQDNYYMPLYLANLFFSGAYLNVYEMNDFVYIFDNFSDLGELESNYRKNSNLTAMDFSTHMENYLALYFDYFYGLKKLKNIDTFKTILENNFSIDTKMTFNSLHQEVEKFLNSQNDLHTSLVSAGYMNKDYSSSTTYNNKMSNYANAYINNKCLERSSEVKHYTYGDTIIVEVNEFTLETRTLLEPVMNMAKNYNEIIIDVSCNPGGNLIGVVELLSYMTDQEIPVSSINPITGSKTIEYYQPSGNVLTNKKFFVYTTAATFSAANLFTSIVKDQNLAVIFGEKTSGGASAITYTVLPDGAIIVNSSNYTLVNKDSVIIEDGIDVDISIRYPFRWIDVINYLTN